MFLGTPSKRFRRLINTKVKYVAALLSCSTAADPISLDDDERQRFLQGSTLEEIYSNSDRAITDFAKESGFLNLL